MPSLTIKNVPPHVHEVLRRRADEAGQSLQAYMLHWVEGLASQPTIEELLDRVAARTSAR